MPIEQHILCAFCNAPWTDDMIIKLDSFNAGCDSCGYGEGVEITLTITCQSCQRVIYKKEGVQLEP